MKSQKALERDFGVLLTTIRMRPGKQFNSNFPSSPSALMRCLRLSKKFHRRTRSSEIKQDSQDMPHYFKPLRRKIGVVTLVLACLLMAGWVRSFAKSDSIRVSWQKTSYHFHSKRGVVTLARHTGSWGKMYWSAHNLVPSETATARPFSDAGIKEEWKLDFGGVVIAEGTPKHETGNSRIVRLTFRYWMLVVPAAVLSAWLLLSKPRAGEFTPPA